MTKFQLGDLAERTKEIKSAVFVGMVSGVVTKLTKRGTKMATFNAGGHDGAHRVPSASSTTRTPRPSRKTPS